MSQLKQSDDGDLAITNNRFTFVEKGEEVAQRIRQNMRTFLSEWFDDLTIGVPYHQIIFVKGTPVSTVEALFKRELLISKDVTGLSRFDPLDLVPDVRRLDLDFAVTHTFSDEDLAIVNLGVP